ncbi:MAG: helix-turn-helix domain-containing protein [Chloroflexi bacterium]|nr:helix-turn-helix domain-containing protein [Chloroflexota bacterium]
MTADIERGPDADQAGGRVEQRILTVLDFLARSARPLTLHESALGLQLPRPTAHRLLTSLVASGWLIASGQPRRYAPSWRVTQLGFAAAVNNPVRAVMLDAAEDLARTTELHTAVGFYEHGDLIFSDQFIYQGRRVEHRLSMLRQHAGTTAAGRVLLAYQDADEIDRALSRELPRGTEHSKTSPEEIRLSLPLIRKRGYEINDRENVPTHGGFAVPVFFSPGKVAAALAVVLVGPVLESTVERYLPAALAAALQASIKLGPGANGAVAV